MLPHPAVRAWGCFGGADVAAAFKRPDAPLNARELRHPVQAMKTPKPQHTKAATESPALAFRNSPGHLALPQPSAGQAPPPQTSPQPSGTWRTHWQSPDRHQTEGQVAPHLQEQKCAVSHWGPARLEIKSRHTVRAAPIRLAGQPVMTMLGQSGEVSGYTTLSLREMAGNTICRQTKGVSAAVTHIGSAASTMRCFLCMVSDSGLWCAAYNCT